LLDLSSQALLSLDVIIQRLNRRMITSVREQVVEQASCLFGQARRLTHWHKLLTAPSNQFEGATRRRAKSMLFLTSQVLYPSKYREPPEMYNLFFPNSRPVHSETAVLVQILLSIYSLIVAHI